MADRRALAGSRAWPAWPFMAARCVTALFGGYAATSAVVSLLARLAPIARVEATGWGMILSFPIFACLGLWAFHEPRLPRVAAVVWGSFAVCAAILLAMGPRP
jgi:hypothetical protein